MKNCGETQEYAYKLLQDGITATANSSSKLFDSKTWTKYLNSQDGSDAGMTAIMKNPKLIDPILWEGNGTNMLVNAGTTHNSATTFFTYTISGLEPHSSVSLTADFYYLLDEESLNIYYQLNGFGASDQLYNGMLRADNSGKILELPNAIIRWTTNLNQGGQPDLPNQTTASNVINLSKKTGAQSKTLTGRADPGGVVTFYFGRMNPDNTPIGIDNIEVKGSVKPSITYSGSPCPMMPVVWLVGESLSASALQPPMSCADTPANTSTVSLSGISLPSICLWLQPPVCHPLRIASSVCAHLPRCLLLRRRRTNRGRGSRVCQRPTGC